MDILSELNPIQKEAVEITEGPLLIIAGPGSGKTRVIAHRIAYLIKECDVRPSRILAVTFTNKAAREMRERVHGLLNDRDNSQIALTINQTPTLGTFHAICSRILRVEGNSIGLDRNFVIYDENDQTDLIKQSLKDLRLDSQNFRPRVIKSKISNAKARLLQPSEYESQSYLEDKVKIVYKRYQELLLENNALDFDDLLVNTVYLFRNSTEIIEKYQSRYLHVMVDEFQDTNLAQYIIAKQIAGKYSNLCVVGDPDQSIYSWRFADPNYILNFEKDYPGAKIVSLGQNYRSTQIIVKAADCVISPNKQRKNKTIWTKNEVGSSLIVAQVYDEQEEAQFVVNEIDRLLNDGNLKPGDFAVLYRTNAQSRVLEEAFIRYGIPYKLVGGTRFYERREVKDILAYLRLIYNPSDSASLTRIINVPGRRIGAYTINKLSEYAGENGVSHYKAIELIVKENQISLNSRIVRSLDKFLTLIQSLRDKIYELKVNELLDLVLESVHYKEYLGEDKNGKDRWENVMELRTVADRYSIFEPQDSLALFLEEIALISDVDNLDEKVNAVALITLHQAKGLEFPVIFIMGVEEKILPHVRSFDSPNQLEEERRLFYVGITRAEKQVYLIYALHRNLWGMNISNSPSRFLDDIPPSLINFVDTGKKAKSQQLVTFGANDDSEDFNVGDHVHHPRFGEGIIMNILANKDDKEVTVAFRGKIKRLLLSYASLDKIT
jgi:DNA helicase-2/ATP-dependent DNA helicase PcrA